MDFDEFQAQAKRTEFFKVQTDNSERELKRLYLLSGLVSQVGHIADRLKKKMRDGPDYELLGQEIEERIGYALWYLAMLANEFGFSLNQVAQKNATFNQRRWRQAIDQPILISANDFDGEYAAQQQLPKRIIAQFETKMVNGVKKTVVRVYPNWPDRSEERNFGDPIDDNSFEEDHYRYHDIFHFAYVAFLGWSPVVRKLLGRKRKVPENPNIDRIGDGARAVDTEEAATAFIYSYVSRQKFLETSDNLDTGVLTTVRTLLRGFEVKACSEKEWERSILAASEVLRVLVENGGGWVEANREKGSLEYLGNNEPN